MLAIKVYWALGQNGKSPLALALKESNRHIPYTHNTGIINSAAIKAPSGLVTGLKDAEVQY